MKCKSCLSPPCMGPDKTATQLCVDFNFEARGVNTHDYPARCGPADCIAQVGRNTQRGPRWEDTRLPSSSKQKSHSEHTSARRVFKRAKTYFRLDVNTACVRQQAQMKRKSHPEVCSHSSVDAASSEQQASEGQKIRTGRITACREGDKK